MQPVWISWQAPLMQLVTRCGPAQTAVERGEFQHSNGRVREDAILAVAHSVATGMQLLHKHGVQHGNLSASAVLLTACKVRLPRCMLLLSLELFRPGIAVASMAPSTMGFRLKKPLAACTGRASGLQGKDL